MKLIQVVKCWLLLCCVFPFIVFAKTEKPTLLVYGGTLQGYIAALQAANSGVPTLWLNTDAYSVNEDLEKLKNDTLTRLLDGGFSSFFGEDDSDEINHNDIVDNYFNQNKHKSSFLTDNPLLYVVNSVDVKAIERTTKYWKVKLSNKLSYNFKVVLDATPSRELANKANLLEFPEPQIQQVASLSLSDSRSIVLTTEYQNNVYSSRLIDVLSQNDNFFVFGLQDFMHDNLPLKFDYGQLMGAVTAYCTFFKTTADKIDLRTLQNELLVNKSRLMPWVNISYTDENFDALQRVFLSGVFPLEYSLKNLIYTKDDSVRVDLIQPVIHKMFSRTQLWFYDNKAEYLTVQDAINLIKFAAFRAEELNNEVEKNWNKLFKFASKYDPTRTISKYEFAVLFDYYAQPFLKKVSQDGNDIMR